VHKTADSALGLLMVFLFTGFIGFYVGPVISLYTSLPGGSSAVVSALGLTAVAFLGLSGYALVTKKDFGFMTGFITVGMWVLLGAIVLGLVFDLGAVRLAISAGVVLLMSALILWQTSAIIHGGETNYIRATATLFMSIYNLFMSLLHLFMAFGGDD
jgi:modulator of FtsH protease